MMRKRWREMVVVDGEEKDEEGKVMKKRRR